MSIGWKTGIAAVVACASAVASGVTYAKQARPEYSLVPAGAAKFAPLDPISGSQWQPWSGTGTGPSRVVFTVRPPARPRYRKMTALQERSEALGRSLRPS
jgi:hypothetical protein